MFNVLQNWIKKKIRRENWTNWSSFLYFMCLDKPIIIDAIHTRKSSENRYETTCCILMVMIFVCLCIALKYETNKKINEKQDDDKYSQALLQMMYIMRLVIDSQLTLADYVHVYEAWGMCMYDVWCSSWCVWIYLFDEDEKFCWICFLFVVYSRATLSRVYVVSVIQFLWTFISDVHWHDIQHDFQATYK